MYKTRTRNTSLGQPSPQRFKELEFKFLYFKLQKIVNRKIQISLKYEQLKQPEINLTLIKPIATKILDLATNNNLNHKIRGRNIPLATLDFRAAMENKTSLLVVYILILLKYEYLIQSETNLIIYDLLMTKANVCELLAIRIFREYKAIDRVNLLFVNPLQQFTTLELLILTKSKRFLSQPIIVQILDKFYNGDLIMSDGDKSTEETGLLKENIVNYKYQRVVFAKINDRSSVVPKYQSLMINLKNMFFTLLHVLIILNQHKDYVLNNWLEGIFYIYGIHLNYEFLAKSILIDHKFLRKILWFYIDFGIIVLVDLNLVLKTLTIVDQVSEVVYFQTFSTLSIMLIPRNLAVFNNYKFFNLIILGFRKMISNIMGLFCLFLSLVIGFYITFISINQHRSNFEIAYDLLQIFFGFTPAVWTNWNSYTSIGKFIQIGYLFLSQFIISTILAIVLSESFSEISLNIKEDFEYFKAVNLVVYFKSAPLHSSRFSYITRLPVLVVIYTYELIMGRLSAEKSKTLKTFTFLNKDRDYYLDTDLVNMDYANDDTDVSLLIKSRKNSVAVSTAQNKRNVTKNPIVPSGVNLGRINSQADTGNVQANSQFAVSHIGTPTTSGIQPPISHQPALAQPQSQVATPLLLPVQSMSTLGNFKSASTDSLFIGDLLSRKYGTTGVAVTKRSPKPKDEWEVVLEKLNNLDQKLDKLERERSDKEGNFDLTLENTHRQELGNSDIDYINQSILDDVDNDSVNLYNIREISYDEASLDSQSLADETQDYTGLDQMITNSDNYFSDNNHDSDDTF